MNKFQNSNNQNQGENYSSCNGTVSTESKVYYVMMNRKLVLIADDINRLNCYIQYCSAEQNAGGNIKMFTNWTEAVLHLNKKIITLMGYAYGWNFYGREILFGIPIDKIKINEAIALSTFIPSNSVQELRLPD